MTLYKNSAAIYVPLRVVMLFQKRQKLGYPYYFWGYSDKSRTIVIFINIIPVDISPPIEVPPTLVSKEFWLDHHGTITRESRRIPHYPNVMKKDITQEDAPFMLLHEFVYMKG